MSPSAVPLKSDEPASHVSAAAQTKRAFIVALLLFAATLAVWDPATGNQFVGFDDEPYVTLNYRVQQGLSWDNVRWAFTTFDVANWHPVTWLSYLLDGGLFHQNPVGYHFENLLWHAMNVVLLFTLLWLATGFLGRSAAVAALFAFHPLNVETVAWVGERKSLLCTFFFFLALLAYGWYVRRPSWRRYLPVAIAFALGLMAKPMIVTFPAVLLLLDWWPLRRASTWREYVSRFPRLFAEKLPFVLMTIASVAVTMMAQRASSAISTTLPFSARFKNAWLSYGLYLKQTVWPAGLAVFYPHPGPALTWARPALSLAALLLISFLVWRSRARPAAVVGWLWYLGVMFPTIGFVQAGSQAMADRYAYLPLIGIFVALVWMAADALQDVPGGSYVGAALALAVLVPLALATRRQLTYWHDEISLFRHAIDVTRDNYMAEDNLGSALFAAGEKQEGMQHVVRALQIQPQLSTPHYNYGRMLLDQGRYAESIQEFRRSLALNADLIEAPRCYNNMGVAYMRLGDAAQARENYRQAIRLDPRESNSWLGLGLLEYQAGNLDQAIADFQRSLQIEPRVIGFAWLGDALEKRGDLPAAIAAYRDALQMAPGSPDLKSHLAALEIKAGAR